MVLKVGKGEAVVVTKLKSFALRLLKGAAVVTALMVALPLTAAVLPADRFDTLFHLYDGGGVEISGPSILLRKQIGNSTSFSANYYVDAITSASIDVITSASPYTEKREEHSLAVDFLRHKSTMSLAYTTSEENDFSAKSVHLGISQDMFGDLTTLSMGYSRGDDTVRKIVNTETGKILDPNFGEEPAERQNFRLGVTQILTKNFLVDLGFELITDSGFLNNPYRQVRFADNTFDFEVYPNTRSSQAVALRAKYYLPYRAAVYGELRHFNDTWGIIASSYEIGYTHPLKSGWVFDLKFRNYEQSRADFYSDLFPQPGAQNFMARDKELSTFNNQTLGLTVSYEFARQGWRFIDRGSINLAVDHLRFNYDNFRDLRVTLDPNNPYPLGEEPLYSFSANVMQFYLSIWY